MNIKNESENEIFLKMKIEKMKVKIKYFWKWKWKTTTYMLLLFIITIMTTYYHVLSSTFMSPHFGPNTWLNLKYIVSMSHNYHLLRLSIQKFTTFLILPYQLPYHISGTTLSQTIILCHQLLLTYHIVLTIIAIHRNSPYFLPL